MTNAIQEITEWLFVRLRASLGEPNVFDGLAPQGKTSGVVFQVASITPDSVIHNKPVAATVRVNITAFADGDLKSAVDPLLDGIYSAIEGQTGGVILSAVWQQDINMSGTWDHRREQRVVRVFELVYKPA